MHSQHDEEKVILEYFGDRVGRFCDIGAADGVTFSNTFALTEKGWLGMCVEPDPYMAYKLCNAHFGNPKIEIMLAAVSVSQHEVHETMLVSDDFVSSFDRAHCAIWGRKGVKFRSVSVWSATIADVRKRFVPPWNFLSIDTEGESARLFLAADLGLLGVELACVERDGQDDRIVEYASRFGMHKIHVTPENVIVGK